MPKYPPPITFLLMFMLCLFTSEIVKGQSTVSYPAYLKNKHFIPLPITSSNDLLVVGTEGDFEGDVSILRIFDGGGNMPGTPLGLTSLHEDYHKKTVVDFTKMNISGTDYYFITCLRRADPSTTIGVTNRDMIEVIGIDDWGTVFYDFYISAPMTHDYWALTPIHTMAHFCLASNITNTNYLYICGYVTSQFEAPLTTDLTSSKMGFVLMVEPVSRNIPGCTFINSVTTVPTAPYAKYDYDAAIRMIPTNNADDDIYVTGCSNIVRQLDPTSSTPVCTAGMLNMAIKGDCSGPASFNKPLGKPYGGFDEGEYGFDMTKLSTNEYVIMGNDFIAGTVNSPLPINYHFSAILPQSSAPSALTPILGTGANYLSPKARRVYHDFNIGWGVQSLPSQISSTDDIVLAGMVTNTATTCPLAAGLISPSVKNYNPFTADYSFSISGAGLSVNQNFVNLYPSNVGTGYGVPNCYDNTQQWTFTNAWSPNFATQGNYTPLVLTAPFWNTNYWYDQLNMKLIFADATGNSNAIGIVGCDNTSTNCIANNSFGESIQVCDNVTISSTLYTSTTTCYPIIPDVGDVTNEHVGNSIYAYIGCDPSYWRPNNVKEAEAISISFVPNPAKDNIQLSVTGSPKNITVWLTDILGRKLVTIYNGETTAMPKQVALPELSAGLYLINTDADGKQLPIQKLTIN